MAEAFGRRGKAVGGTQSFVHTLSACWAQKSLTAMEIAWRWTFGIPALTLLILRGRQVLSLATEGTFDVARLGLDRVLINDPVGALSGDPTGTAKKLVLALTGLRAELSPSDWALLPLLAIAWVVISSIGRSLVLRRARPGAHARIGTLMALQAMRTTLLALVFALWVWLAGQAGSAAVTAPLARGEEPNLVLYCALVIVLSLGMFTAWGFVSWILTVAPMLAQVRDLGVGASIRAALALGPVRAKLVEINQVLGIVKIALIVLAMVFSATPLPFQAVTSAGFLEFWWAGVAFVYLLWADFFHVARMLAYLGLLQNSGAVVDEK